MFKNQTAQIVVFLTSLVLLYFFYGNILIAPNDYLFAPNGDGIKNYYAYMFHAKYDHSFWHFGGMNYPYYEHMVYTDGHPLLSFIIGKFGLVEYGVGILNFLMLFSIPICAIFIYKILNHFKVEKWWAISASVLIAFMSPQIFRVTGHLSLSYMFAIPMLWWLLIWFNKKKTFLRSGLLSLYVLIFFFTHPYLGLILISFAFAYHAIYFITNHQKRLIYFVHFLIQCILPLVIFQALVFATDTHTDRLGEPAGFFHYYASWKSIFVPHTGPLNYFTNLFIIDVGNWESWNYVGFSFAIFGMLILVFAIKNRRQINLKKVAFSELGMYCIAAHLVLMFAFCFPLKYDVFRGIVDLIGPLKQFRVLGRFGWIFFYVFTIAMVILLNRLKIKTEKKLRYNLLFYLGTLLTCFEFYPVHKIVSEVIQQSPNVFKKEKLTKDMQAMIAFIDKERPTALMMLPFQHMSSENVMILGTEKANYESFLLSYHTGKPLMNSVTSRMSLSEAIDYNNFFAPEFVEKELIKDIPVDAKILIIKNNEGIKLSERKLIYTSSDAYANQEFKSFYFNADNYNNRYYFDQIMAQADSANFTFENGWRSSDSRGSFIYESFDEKENELTMKGKGSYELKKGGYDKIYEFETRNLSHGKYVISFWYYIMIDRPDVLAVAEIDSVGDKGVYWQSTFEVSQSNHIVNGWCQVNIPLEINSEIEKVNVLITGNGNGKPYFIDELFIYADTVNYFNETIMNNQSYIIYNNYYLKKSSFNSN